MTIDPEEFAQLVDSFINHFGMFQEFKEYADSMGYKLEELGIQDEE